MATELFDECHHLRPDQLDPHPTTFLRFQPNENYLLLKLLLLKSVQNY